VSLVARVVRQFHDGAEALTLERLVALPCQPTMGTRLDLRAQDVEAALEVVAVTVRAHPDGPGFCQADIDLYLTPEPLAHAVLAREGGWRDSNQS
jgi:hypothetical protein